MINASLELMKQMKLTGMKDAYEAIASLPVDKHPLAHELMARLLDAEQQYRAEKKMKMFLRLSKLRYQVTIQDIDCGESRNFSRETRSLLSTCTFIDRGENVLITGATGCGKSYLACALGNNACVKGYRTIYLNMNRFAEQIAVAKAEGTFVKWLDRLRRTKLLILDDFGLQPINHTVKLALLQILEDRYERGATIICAQIPVASWHEYIDDPTIADAILDRLITKAHKVNLKGESLRKKVKQLS